ncbi:MAG: hypothetical protein MJA83_05160 [Gammaproteobacteria bacterium]|nr:hypothetical protein [Gammaproteobacteria bacterium]
MRIFIRAIAILCFVLLISACAAPGKPDLKRLYGRSALADDQPPVILIHGIMGAKLRDRASDKEHWPGSIMKLLFNRYRDIALDIDAETLLPKASRLEPYEITDKTAGHDFYGAIIRTLEDAGGYSLGTPGKAVTGNPRQYYVFIYDWRQDNVESARRLSALIEQIRLDYNNPELKFDIIAHSMGGLIARYYLRYGTLDVLDDNEFPVNNHGAERIRRVILLGTPNLGSVGSLKGFIEGKKLVFQRIPTEVLITMPSTYQLFPHPLNDWIIKSDGEALNRDLFDATIWRRFQWSIYDPKVRERIIKSYENPEDGRARVNLLQRYFEKHIERARRFVWSLTVGVPDPKVNYIVFGGDCHLTPARVLVEEIDNESVLRLWPKKIKVRIPGVDYEELMLEPGDGTVTKASLLARESLDPTVPRHKYSFFPMDYSFFLCAGHSELTGNIYFQDNLLHALLNRDE